MSIRFAAVLTATLALAACKKADPPQPSPPSQPAVGDPAAPSAEEGSAGAGDAVVREGAPVEIQLGPDPAAMGRGVRIAPGRSPSQLYARVLDAEYNVLDVAVAWHSLDPERVEVDALGRLTALGPLGPAFITASVGELLADPLPIYVVSAGDLPAPPVDEAGGSGAVDASLTGGVPAAGGSGSGEGEAQGSGAAAEPGG